MIYVKAKLPTGSIIHVPIKDNGIFCYCPVCGNETTVEYDIFATIVEEGGLEETGVYCEPCSDKYRAEKEKRKLIRIK